MSDFEQLTFVWQSFGPDSRCLEQSVLSVQAVAPGARIVVASDEADPVSDAVRRALEGVEWFDTTWDRNGNGNGLEHLQRQLQFFRHVSPAGPVVKIDSDVVLQDARWLAKEDWTALRAVATTQPAWWFQGGCYGLSPEAVRNIEAVVCRAESVCPHQGPRWPEDQVTGELMAALAADEIRHHHGWPVGQAVAHYDYAGNAPFGAYRAFWVVNFGGRAGIKAPEVLRRGLAADTMRAFREWSARGG